jgi:RNA polymerase sigma factor (sigma-70 family)
MSTTLETIDAVTSITSTEATSTTRRGGKQKKEVVIVEPIIDADNISNRDYLTKYTITFWDEIENRRRTLSKGDFKKTAHYQALMGKITLHSTGMGGISTIEANEPEQPGTEGSWDETDAVIDAEKSDVEGDPIEQERTEERKQLLKEVKLVESDKRGLMLGMSNYAVAFNQNTRDLALQIDYEKAVNGGAFSAFYTTLFGFIVMAFQQNGRFRYLKSREIHMTSEDHAQELAITVFERLRKSPVSTNKIVNYVAMAIKNYSRPINQVWTTEKEKRDIHGQAAEAELNAIRGTGGGKRVGAAPTDAWDGSNYGFDPTDAGYDPESGLRHGDLRDQQEGEGEAEESSSARDKTVSREIIEARSEQLDEYISKQKASEQRILMITREGANGKELTQGQVAKASGVSLATVKRVLNKAKKNLTQEAA